MPRAGRIAIRIAIRRGTGRPRACQPDRYVACGAAADVKSVTVWCVESVTSVSV